jgi:hypothetical protein
VWAERRLFHATCLEADVPLSDTSCRFDAAQLEQVLVADRPRASVCTLFPAEQARIGGLLVERVTVSSTGADIRMRVKDLAGLVRNLGTNRPVLEVAE